MSGALRAERGHRLTLFVPADLDGERLDRALARLMPALSRSYLKKLSKEGFSWVNDVRAAPDHCVRRGDRITLQLDRPVVPPCHPEARAVDVRYEDAHTLVVCKPAGVVTHPAKGHAAGTLLNAVVGYLGDEIARGWARPHVLTRLDKQTSGLILIAKTPQAHRALQRALESRRITRCYMALVWGRVSAGSGSVSIPLAPDRAQGLRMLPDDGGRQAITVYRRRRVFVVASSHQPLTQVSLLHLWLETGRTHQIRAHMAAIGHPVLGDDLYGPRPPGALPSALCDLLEALGGLALHARQVRFPDPLTADMRRVSAPPPEPFRDLLRWLHRHASPSTEGAP